MSKNSSAINQERSIAACRAREGRRRDVKEARQHESEAYVQARSAALMAACGVSSNSRPPGFYITQLQPQVLTGEPRRTSRRHRDRHQRGPHGALGNERGCRRALHAGSGERSVLQHGRVHRRDELHAAERRSRWDRHPVLLHGAQRDDEHAECDHHGHAIAQPGRAPGGGMPGGY